MLTTVHLNDNPSLTTNKIDNIGSNWFLSNELISKQ